MDVPVTIENIPFAWGIAFFLDIITGFLMFATIIRRAAPPWTLGAACWVGWWSWASAFTLVINVTVGTTNPFSYHQIGILTESMTNLGILWWLSSMSFRNWYIFPKDWKRFDQLRAEVTNKNLRREIQKKYDDDGE